MLAQQLDIWGGSRTAGDVVAKITHLLENNRRCCNSYKLMMLYYWKAYDGLDNALKYDRFAEWWLGEATMPKTLVNRCMEIQRRRPDLAASPRVQAVRKRQATQGVVR